MVHPVPFTSSAHAEMPLHEALPAHSLSGSLPALIGPQVPSEPEPFLATLHAWQSVVHVLLQQTPSTQ